MGFSFLTSYSVGDRNNKAPVGGGFAAEEEKEEEGEERRKTCV
jgi:hypothetical protein